MILSRRSFLATGALAMLPPSSFLAAPSVLRAAPASAQLLPEDYEATDVWAYGGGVPGPELRIRQGERLVQRLENALEQPTTIHWHGLRLPNSMDGVPGLTQQAVAAGASFDYDFVAPDAGTFWYHPHNRTWEQMARGLSGALVVEEAEGAPEVDLDAVLMIDDWLLTEKGEIAGGFGALHDRAHGGRLGNYLSVNGRDTWSATVTPGARMRLRLVNCANARIFEIAAQDLEGWVVALDGMPLTVPEPFSGLTLAPAQRADLILDVAGDAPTLAMVTQQGGLALTTIEVAGRPQASRPAPAPLPPNPVASLGDLNAAPIVPLVMEGGAMGGMTSARLGDKDLSLNDLVDAGYIWSLAGRADMPKTPLAEAGRGDTMVIEITNRTAWPHAMHLHGHHFHALGPSGPGPLRDTLLVLPDETARIAFVADNPGDWLLHCHMLEHAASGMTTWIRVT